MFPFWQFAAVVLSAFAIGGLCGFCLHAWLVGPAIDARDEALNLAIDLIHEANARLGLPSWPPGSIEARFLALVRSIPEKWAPPTAMVIRRD